VIQLSGESVNVSAHELLAIESTLDFNMFLIGEGLSGMTGGMFGAKVSGTGSLAIAVHGDPMVLPVTPANDLRTDPHATVAWTEGLEPKLSVDLVGVISLAKEARNRSRCISLEMVKWSSNQVRIQQSLT
jgi:uncharacterized protein (AIM24 family)